MSAMTATKRLRKMERSGVEMMRTLREAIRELEPEEVFQPSPWGDEDLENFGIEDDWGPDEEEPGLEGLGNFFKKVAHVISKVALAPIKAVAPKVAAKLSKVDDKVIGVADKVWTASGDLLHKVGGWVVKRLGKNWKWIAVIVAIAITIYTMGAGSAIAAHIISAMQAIGHAIAAGAAAVGHLVGIGTGAAAASGAAATGAAVATGTTVATGAAATSGFLGLSTSTWTSLALTAGKALVTQRAKVSDLSQAQAQAVLQAQDSGYELGANDPQFRAALETRAAIPGLGIPTDAYGNPLVNPSQVGAGILQPDGTVIPGGPTMQGTLALATPGMGGGYGGGGGAGYGSSGLPSWALPAAAIGGIGLIALLARRK